MAFSCFVLLASVASASVVEGEPRFLQASSGGPSTAPSSSPSPSSTTNTPAAACEEACPAFSALQPLLPTPESRSIHQLLLDNTPGYFTCRSESSVVQCAHETDACQDDLGQLSSREYSLKEMTDCVCGGCNALLDQGRRDAFRLADEYQQARTRQGDDVQTGGATRAEMYRQSWTPYCPFLNGTSCMASDSACAAMSAAQEQELADSVATLECICDENAEEGCLEGIMLSTPGCRAECPGYPPYLVDAYAQPETLYLIDPLLYITRGIRGGMIMCDHREDIECAVASDACQDDLAHMYRGTQPAPGEVSLAERFACLCGTCQATITSDTQSVMALMAESTDDGLSMVTMCPMVRTMDCVDNDATCATIVEEVDMMSSNFRPHMQSVCGGGEGRSATAAPTASQAAAAAVEGEDDNTREGASTTAVPTPNQVAAAAAEGQGGNTSSARRAVRAAALALIFAARA